MLRSLRGDTRNPCSAADSARVTRMSALLTRFPAKVEEQRHLLPSQPPHYHHQPTHHPHASGIRRLHPKPFHHFRDRQSLLQLVNDRFIFFSTRSPTYLSPERVTRAAVNLMPLPLREEDTEEDDSCAQFLILTLSLNERGNLMPSVLRICQPTFC